MISTRTRLPLIARLRIGHVVAASILISLLGGFVNFRPANRNPTASVVEIAQASGWRYENKDGTVHKATLTSTNEFKLTYPFTGGTPVTLTIRAKGGNTYVYLEVAKGTFTRSFQSGKARIRFDSRPPVTYALSAAANGRANIVFFDQEQRLIKQLKTARTMSVQLQFAGQNQSELRFNTAGLRWNL
ncbi:hypothetical protein GCM10027341_45520 [Spirosoma knui]